MNQGGHNTPWDGTPYSDAELVALAQHQGARWAADALIVRHFEYTRKIVARLALAAALQPHDVENAQQDAFFAMRRAILRYDLSNPAYPFRGFLRKLVRDRFRDFLKRWWRRRRRECLCGDTLLGTDGAAAMPPWLAALAGWQGEPLLAAQQREALAALDRAVGAFDETERRQWEEWCRDTPADVLARRLGCCPGTIRRQRQKLLATLQEQLGSKY